MTRGFEWMWMDAFPPKEVDRLFCDQPGCRDESHRKETRRSSLSSLTHLLSVPSKTPNLCVGVEAKKDRLGFQPVTGSVEAADGSGLGAGAKALHNSPRFCAFLPAHKSERRTPNCATGGQCTTRAFGGAFFASAGQVGI